MWSTRKASSAGLVVALLALLGLVWAARLRRDPPAAGVVIDHVAVESAAAKVGLSVGDRVLTYDDRRLSSPAALHAAMENTLGKSAVALRVRRGDVTRTLTVPQGDLGVDLRFDLVADALKSYDAGSTALQAQQLDEAISTWTAAARAAQDAGDKPAAAWLHESVGKIYESRQQWEPARAAHTAAWALLAKSSDAAAQSQVLSALGRCSRSINDFQAAEQWFTRAWQVNAAAGNEIWAAGNLNELGLLIRAHGDPAAAQDYHARALAIRERLVPNSLSVAESLDNLGLIAFDRGDLAAAEGLHTRGLAIRERLAPNSLVVATSLNNLGNVSWQRGDLAAAKDRHSRALAVRELLAPDSLDVAASLNNLGLVSWDSGELAAAQGYHSRALAIREKLAPGSLAVATSLNNLGEVARDRGDLAAAQDFHSRSLAIKEPLAPRSVAVAKSLNNLGEIARERGDFGAAQDFHSRAFAIRAEIAPNSLELATSLNNLGETARRRGDLPGARKYHSQALELRKRLAPGSLDVAESLDHLGDVALVAKDLPESRDSYSRALEIRERMAPSSLQVAESLTNLGALATIQGDLKAAGDDYNRALSIRERLAPGSLEVAASLAVMGDGALRGRRFPDALSLFGRSVTIVEAQRRQITSTDARALLLAQHSTPYAGLLRTHVALSDLPAAFATLERARARSLVDLLAERRLDFRTDAPVDLLTRQDELDEKRSEAYTALTDTFAKLTETRTAIGKLDAIKERARMTTLEGTSQTLDKRMDELRERLVKYPIQQRDLDAQIRRASPKLAALQYPEPLDLKGAQAALDTGTLLLAYVVDEGTTYLFAVTKNAFQLFTLPVGRARLAEQVRSFRSVVAKEQLGNPAEPGRQLYDTLVRPAQALVDRAQRVLLCPDGPLQVLPFAALVSRPDPQLRYFIDDRPLHTISSMTVYAETRTHAVEARRATHDGTHNVALLAFGDPIYTQAQAAAASEAKAGAQTKADTPHDTEAAYVRRRGMNLAPLPRTREEVQTIVGLFGPPARARLGPEATEAAAKREAKDADILHFASHGWIDEAMGLSSGLALSQPEALGRAPTVEDDGLLQAWEIFERVRLKADLVVLSACQTGLGEDIRGEGLMGLTRAFLYAGARSVAVSLWDVSDGGTAEFMKTFYQELRNGTSKDVALQRAMIAVHSNPSRKHPFYWAPFILVGDWQ